MPGCLKRASRTSPASGFQVETFGNDGDDISALLSYIAPVTLSQAPNLPIMAGFEDDGLIPINANRDVVVCTAETSIQVAAILMSKRSVGSIVVVDDNNRPVGIITDTDLRRKVIAGKMPHSEPVKAIMSSPVLTVTPGPTAAEVVLKMMRLGVRHLCVTADGTPNSEVVGIVSEHDVLLLHGNNPSILIKEITQSKDVQQLAHIRDRAEQLVLTYVQQEVSARFISDIITAINDSLVAKLVALGQDRLKTQGLANTGLKFCWLSCGSDGRKEQWLRTDQDNGLVYEDPVKGQEETARHYFTALGNEVCCGLEQCGFAKCPGGNMASNPQWSVSLSTWKEYFREWIRVPREDALLRAAIFFDFRPACGESTLADELRRHISSELSDDKKSLILLARNVLRNPAATNVWDRLSTERVGGQKGKFDVKLRAMKPLVEAARVLALDHGIGAITNTMERFQHLSGNDQSVAAMLPEVVPAFELFMRHRLTYGNRGRDAGRYLDVSSMNAGEIKRLRQSLGTLRTVFNLVRVRYQLDALGLR